MTSTTNQLLLIEDDPDIAVSLQNGLRREGYEVIWKPTGAGGIESSQYNPPHLIILDVRLPDSSGFDVCRRLRQLGSLQPIIMLTVQREETDKVIGLEVGADDYLTKPFSFRELVARIRAHLRRAYGELATLSTDLLFFHDITIDLLRTQVKRGEEIIALTPTEFRLLTYLAQSANQTLTRNQLLDAVWGYTSEADAEKVVKVYVRRLREKIEPDPSNPQIILTMPGIGYQLRR